MDTEQAFPIESPPVMVSYFEDLEIGEARPTEKSKDANVSLICDHKEHCSKAPDNVRKVESKQ